MDNQYTEVLVGCYGEGGSACIHWLKIHAESGEIERLGERNGIVNPSFLAKHPVKNRVYAVSEVEDGEVVCYELDDENHRLKEEGRLPTHGGPCYAEVSDCGNYLFVSNYSRAGVVVYALDEKEICRKRWNILISPLQIIKTLIYIQSGKFQRLLLLS